jgi:hypothetical protein
MKTIQTLWISVYVAAIRSGKICIVAKGMANQAVADFNNKFIPGDES